jgi:hypothetical protein
LLPLPIIKIRCIRGWVFVVIGIIDLALCGQNIVVVVMLEITPAIKIAITITVAVRTAGDENGPAGVKVCIRLRVRDGGCAGRSRVVGSCGRFRSRSSVKYHTSVVIGTVIDCHAAVIGGTA